MISLLLLLALVVSSEGCSLAEPPPKISMEANMYKYVVSDIKINALIK